MLHVLMKKILQMIVKYFVDYRFIHFSYEIPYILKDANVVNIEMYY